MLAAFAVSALLVAAGCGGDSTPGGTETGAATKLVITIYPQGRGDQTFAKWELECAPPGGSIPEPKQACEQLESADPTLFEPLPADTVCTQQFGGPEAADVEGTLRGRPIQAQFARFDGCQIERWERLRLLFPAGDAT